VAGGPGAGWRRRAQRWQGGAVPQARTAAPSARSVPGPLPGIAGPTAGGPGARVAPPAGPAARSSVSVTGPRTGWRPASGAWGPGEMISVMITQAITTLLDTSADTTTLSHYAGGGEIDYLVKYKTNKNEYKGWTKPLREPQRAPSPHISSAELLELPVPVVQGAHCPGLEPALNAVKVESVV